MRDDQSLAGFKERSPASKPAIDFEREEDGQWIAEIPSIPGVMAYGNSKEEAASKVLALKVKL